MKISIIIPAHNEEYSLPLTVRGLEDALNIEHELIIVNDHSLDKTADVLKALSWQFPAVKPADNMRQRGFANAIRTGFEMSKAEYVVCVMADLCDEPAAIIRMLDKINQGFDIVCGSRYSQGGKKVGGPRLKTFFSKVFGFSLFFFIGIPTRDIANSFKMYRRDILEKIKIDSKGFEISVEVPLKAFFAGYKIAEVPTTWIDRKEGRSKFNLYKTGPAYFKLYAWALFKHILNRIKIINLTHQQAKNGGISRCR